MTSEADEYSYMDLLSAEWLCLMEQLKENPRVNQESVLFKMLQEATLGLLMQFVTHLSTVLKNKQGQGIPVTKSLKEMTSIFGCPDLNDEDIEFFHNSLERLHAVVEAANSE